MDLILARIGNLSDETLDEGYEVADEGYADDHVDPDGAAEHYPVPGTAVFLRVSRVDVPEANCSEGYNQEVHGREEGKTGIC